jgi:hypothetical protein
MADDVNLGFERQSASYETFLRGTMSAFNKWLKVAEQNRSLRIVTRLIVLGADHDQPRRRHLGGELYRFTNQEATFGVDGWLCICPA